MDTSTYEILKECNSGCRMALNSIEQLAVYLKSQELQDLFCKYKEDYEKMEKESIRLSEGKLQEEKLSEKAAETFAWISAEVKMMLNDDSSKIAEMMIDAFPEAKIYHVYGLTEACPRVSYLPPEQFRENNTYVGIPLKSVKLKIMIL